MSTQANFLSALTGGQLAMTGQDLTAEFKVYYQRTLLENVRENLIHQQFGRQFTIPKGGGKSTEWRRALPFVVDTAALTPLTEGVPPLPLPFKYEAITVGFSQYGQFVRGTDVVSVVTYDPLLENISEELGDSAGRVLETLTVEALNGGTNLLIAKGAATWQTLATTDVIGYDTFITARTIMERNHARPTEGRWYAACMHPNVEADIWRDTDFKDAFKRNDEGKRIYDGEVTRVLGFIITVSNLAKMIPKTVMFGGVANATTDVYSTLIFGKGAFGIVEWASLGMEHIYNPVGSGKTSDPLHQIWTSGWKCSFAVKILNEKFMLRIMSAAGVGELP